MSSTALQMPPPAPISLRLTVVSCSMNCALLYFPTLATPPPPPKRPQSWLSLGVVIFPWPWSREAHGLPVSSEVDPQGPVGGD